MDRGETMALASWLHLVAPVPVSLLRDPRHPAWDGLVDAHPPLIGGIGIAVGPEPDTEGVGTIES